MLGLYRYRHMVYLSYNLNSKHIYIYFVLSRTYMKIVQITNTFTLFSILEAVYLVY